MSDHHDDYEPVLLDAPRADSKELVDHPQALRPEEEAVGQTLAAAIDTADDDDNGLGDVGGALVGVAAFTGAGHGHSEALRRARIVRDCLLAHGVPEVSIELQPGRPVYAGEDQWNALDPVAVLSHHIASNPSPGNPVPGLGLVKRGRPDLGGPLANGTAGVDLVYRILTLGLANHPGYGGPWTVSGPCGTFIIPKDNARPFVWGTEYEGGYTDAVWDATYTHASGVAMTFREFMGRCNAGLVEAVWAINSYGRTPPRNADLSGYHGEHKTWAPGRKPDRRNYTTEDGRAEIRRYETRMEDDVAAEDVWDHPIPVFDGEKGATKPARLVAAQTHNRALDARRLSYAGWQQAKRNREAIEALAETLPKDVAQRVRKALGEPVPEPVLLADGDAGTGPDT